MTGAGTRPMPERPWVGVNFWSRAGGPRMWTDRYSAATVRQELEVLATHGCRVTRSFCYWPDFVPRPEELDRAVLDRFSDFLDAHREAGMTTIPTFLVGHMSGENWDPVWRQGRDLYRDVWFVAQQAWFVAEVAGRFADHPAVGGWLLTNEVPIYGGPAPTEEVASWARILLLALRSAGVTQPVSIGDGAWGVENTGDDTGFSLRRLAPMVDFLGPHVYPMSDDPVRQNSAAALACLLSSSFGRPVVLEEFGVSSDFAADDHAANYYRQVLHSSLLAGARGWLAWNNCDYDDLADQDPYRHHPFEMHFGLTDRKGAPKPALLEVARFANLVDELGITAASPATPAQAALVVPEHFERTVPFTTSQERRDFKDVLLQSFVACREADLDVGIARERDGIGNGARLYLLPSTKQLTAPTMDRLAERVAEGAVLYWSYFPGGAPTQRGPWIYRLGDVFGVRHRLRYGLHDRLDDDRLELRFLRPFGSIEAGETLVFPVAGEPFGRTYLPVEPVGAEVVATDAHGRPALLTHELGRGRAVLCTYPVEYMAARTPWVNPEPTWRVYDAAADLASVARPVRCDDGRVSCSLADFGHVRLVCLTNLSDERVGVAVRSPGWTGPDPVDLDPYEVRTFTVPGGGPGSAHHR